MRAQPPGQRARYGLWLLSCFHRWGIVFEEETRSRIAHVAVDMLGTLGWSDFRR